MGAMKWLDTKRREKEVAQEWTAKRNLNFEDFEKETPCQSSPLYSASREAVKQPA